MIGRCLVERVKFLFGFGFYIDTLSIYGYNEHMNKYSYKIKVKISRKKVFNKRFVISTNLYIWGGVCL